MLACTLAAGAATVRADDLQAELPAPANPSAHRILLLHAGRARPSGTAAQVERSLRGALEEMGFAVTASPLPFGEAQLAAGCPGSVGKCGSHVASAIESEQLAVTELDAGKERGTLALRLYLFAPSGEARQGSAELEPSSSPEHIEAAVRELARNVYAGAPTPSAGVAGRKRAPAPQRDSTQLSASSAARSDDGPSPHEPRERNAALWAAGWTTVALGSAVLLGGIGTNVAARRAGSAYARADVRSSQDADRALADYDRSERKSDAARVLFGAGGALLLTGATLLIWERLANSRDNTLQLAVLPSFHSGASVALAARFERRLW